MSFKRALVTGGAGFIGSHMSEYLLDSGYEVFIVDNYRRGRRANVVHHFKKTKCFFDKREIQSPGIYDLFKIFKPEIVFHMASMSGIPFSIDNPTDSDETNINGTVNLLNLSVKHGVKRFIFSSSSSVYGGSLTLPTPEDTVLVPKSPYALQKKVGEEYCRMFSNLYGLETVNLRYFNVFGPRQYGGSPYSSVISSFVDALKNDETPEIHGDGDQFRDFCYVDNVVQANMLAATYEGKLMGDTFNIGCGSTISVNELHKLIGCKPANYLDSRVGDVRCSQADISRASKVLGYKVVVPFEEGLRRTVKWGMSQ